LGDGEAKASAAVAARHGAVGLREDLEDLVARLGRDADAIVAHREAEAHGLALALDEARPYFDPALSGELDRVGDEIDEDLAQLQRQATICPRQPRVDA